MTANTLRLTEIEEGRESAFSREICAGDIDAFAEVSGDFSPLHMDAEFARARGYADRVVHGAFLAGLVSRLIGMQLPGKEAVWQNLALTFHAPTYPGYRVEVRGTVQRKLEALGAMQLAVEIRHEGKTLVSGKAQVGFTQTAGKAAANG